MTEVGASDALDDRIERAFGVDNRTRLLEQYFTADERDPVTPSSAWRHVYALLLWIDRTIGLAHCYESDKCQPGRPWYARSLSFHAWLADQLGVAPRDVGNQIDWLFRTASLDLARGVESRRAQLGTRALEQRERSGADMPLPGEDPELEELIGSTIQSKTDYVVPPDVLQILVVGIYGHYSAENKRKNLVGEGFEDTVAELLRRIPAIARRYEIHVRPALHELPGFYPPRGTDKTKHVDLVLLRRSDQHRTLVSCKWSIRSDREEQFATDFDAYARLEASGTDFGYVLITNEFDPARLSAACDNRRPNGYLFDAVVHVNPDGPLAAYAAPVSGARRGGGVERIRNHVQGGRLSSLASWLDGLQQ